MSSLGSSLQGYEQLVVEGLVREDALCILGSGLGWQRIMAMCVRLHHYKQVCVLCVLCDLFACYVLVSLSCAVLLKWVGNCSVCVVSPCTYHPIFSACLACFTLFLTLFMPSQMHTQTGALLIVGCLPWQKEVLLAELARHDQNVLPPADISAEVCVRQKCRGECSVGCLSAEMECFMTTHTHRSLLLSTLRFTNPIAAAL